MSDTNTSSDNNALLQFLANTILLGECQMALYQIFGSYELLAHWLQGEFHHDLVFRVANAVPRLPGEYLVVSTNCNGGVKDILCFDTEPGRDALWHHRCPDNPEFEGRLPEILGEARTHQWFDPCELLRPDARSELRPEARRRQRGGGWRHIDDLED